MIYSINYDLRRPGQDYAALHGEIKTLGEWWHYLESCWLLNTSLHADVISDRLRSKIDSNDRLLVIDVGRNYAGWLPQDAWAWIQARV